MPNYLPDVPTGTPYALAQEMVKVMEQAYTTKLVADEDRLWFYDTKRGVFIPISDRKSSESAQRHSRAWPAL